MEERARAATSHTEAPAKLSVQPVYPFTVGGRPSHPCSRRTWQGQDPSRGEFAFTPTKGCRHTGDIIDCMLTMCTQTHCHGAERQEDPAQLVNLPEQAPAPWGEEDRSPLRLAPRAGSVTYLL